MLPADTSQRGGAHHMDYFRRFNFLFSAPTFDPDDLEGLRFNQIIDEIEGSGFEVVKARRLEDAEIAVKTDAAIGCMVVDWGKRDGSGKLDTWDKWNFCLRSA